MKDYLQKAYCFNKNVIIYTATSTNLVEKARQIHGLWPTASAALGRTLTISAMMSAMYKANEHLTIQIAGDGPLGKLIVEACNGKVRGFVHNPEVFIQYSNGKLNVGAAVGHAGTLTVTKDLNMKAPFSSTSDLISGEIAEDFTYYFAKSEQIPSSVGLGVIVNPDNSVSASGGFIIQIMPGCPEEIIKKLEDILATLKPCSQMVSEGYTPQMMIKEITNDDYQLLETKEIAYECPCSYLRFYNGIKTIGSKEINKILAEDRKALVTCHFCNKTYNFDEQALTQMLDELKDA